jgi:hypothetical protein
MKTEADHPEKDSAPSAIALLWLMLRQVIALTFSGASGLLDKLERDLRRHILAQARKLAELKRAQDRDHDNNRDNDSNDNHYRIACIKGRFIRVPVTTQEIRDPKIRRAAILGQVQFARFLRAVRLARHVIGAGHAFASRRLKALLLKIIDSSCAPAASASGAPRLTAERIRAPP